MTHPDFEMVVPFDRDTEDFARGVEIGMLWERMRSESRPVVAVVHEANIEMILRLADAAGATARAEDLGGQWLAVEFR